MAFGPNFRRTADTRPDHTFAPDIFSTNAASEGLGKQRERSSVVASKSLILDLIRGSIAKGIFARIF
jgi:hypothetical protein